MPSPVFTVTTETGSSQDYTVKIIQDLDAFVVNYGEANKVWLNNGGGATATAARAWGR